MDSTSRSLSPGERIWHVAAAVLLLAYGGAGLYYDDIYIPGKHSRGMHFHGVPAWIMFAAFVCASLNLLSVFADHFDKSDGDRMYHIIARTTQVAGWLFFACAIGFGLSPEGRSPW